MFFPLNFMSIIVTLFRAKVVIAHVTENWVILHFPKPTFASEVVQTWYLIKLANLGTHLEGKGITVQILIRVPLLVKFFMYP